MRTGIREGAEWENHILQQAEDPAVIIQDSWRGCHCEPQHQRLRLHTAPTTVSGRASFRNAAHRRTIPQIAANCRTLPHKFQQARAGKGRQA